MRNKKKKKKKKEEKTDSCSRFMGDREGEKDRNPFLFEMPSKKAQVISTSLRFYLVLGDQTKTP